MINKLAIGTVQFGLKYGINNKSGQVSESIVMDILNLAESEGISTLDTAYAYGSSEQVLGQTKRLEKFKVVTKFPASHQNVREKFSESCERLRLEKVYGYMLHNFSSYGENKGVWAGLQELKQEGLVEKIGCSLNEPSELEALWKDNIQLDIVQLPYNLFDRRFKKLFPKLKSLGTEIHTRSTFLQGLFFVPLDELDAQFLSVRSKLASLRELSRDSGKSIAGLCLGFSASNPYINKVVIGIDKVEHLVNNIADLHDVGKTDLFPLEHLEVKDTQIINPSKWKLA